MKGPVSANSAGRVSAVAGHAPRHVKFYLDDSDLVLKTPSVGQDIQIGVMFEARRHMTVLTQMGRQAKAIRRI